MAILISAKDPAVNNPVRATNGKPAEYDTVNNFADISVAVKKGIASSTGLILAHARE